MSNNEEKSLFAQPRTIASGIVLLLVLAVAAYLVIVGASSDESNGSDGPTAAPTTTTTPIPTDPSSTDSSGVTYESACGLKGGSLQAPKTAPTDIDWQTVDGWSYPVSPSAGPGKRSPSGSWSCFARTPAGAVIAAHVISYRLTLADDFESVVKQQTIPGIGQQELLKTGQEESQGGITDPKGFIIENYSNDDAVISLYVVQDQKPFTCSQEVQWRDGDWKLRLQADGSASSGCIQTAPSIFVPWGP